VYSLAFIAALAGLIGARLASVGGSEMSAVARGATLAALRRNGLRLTSDKGEIRATVSAAEDQAELGAQDLVVLAVKGPALPAVAARIGPLLGPTWCSPR
jgi:2-dehydropantoate 2-reductase